MTSVYCCAIRLLSRREHSVFELFKKLKQKGYLTLEIQETIQKCQELGFQSDKRFAENLCRTRINQGYGPRRIQNELQSVDVAYDIIDAVLHNEQENWLQHAQILKRKKCKQDIPLSFSTLQKQKRFFFQRGFSSEIINQIFKYDEVIKP